MLQVLRGCHIRSSGEIERATTGYDPVDFLQDAKNIQQDGVCRQKPPFRDYSGMSPDDRIRAYRVSFDVNLRAGDHPVRFHVRSMGRVLQPSQVYASYLLTSLSILYGGCGKGFAVARVFGTTEAEPGHFDDPGASDDMAEFVPLNAKRAGKLDLHLGYTCIRSSMSNHRHP